MPAQAMLAYADDAVLEHLRGRYVNAGEIVKFGVQMVTTWRTPSGQMSGVAQELISTPQGQATVTQYALNGGQSTPGPLGVPQGLQSTQGVVQLSQQAANSTQTSNTILVDINNSNSTNNNALTGNWQVKSQGVATGNASMAVMIDQGLAGRTGQSIGQGQVMQFSTLAANNVATANTLRVQLWLRPQGTAPLSIPSRTMMIGIR